MAYADSTIDLWAESLGGYARTAVHVRNKSGIPVQVDLLGVAFVPDGEQQRIGLVGKVLIDVPAWGEAQLDVESRCLDHHRPGPAGGQRMSVIRHAIPVFLNHDLVNGASQQAIWNITDNDDGRHEYESGVWKRLDQRPPPAVKQAPQESQERSEADRQRREERLRADEAEGKDAERRQDAAERRRQFREQQQQAMEQAMTSVVELLTLTIVIGEKMGNARRNRTHGVSAPDGDTMDAAFTCDSGIISPGILGWCHHGTFYGPLHLGSLFYARTGASTFAVGQVAIVTSTHRDFYGLVQAGLGNTTRDTFHGLFQLGLVNDAGSFYGLAQVGWINTAGTVGLVQLGAYNDADDAYGLQIAAIMNRGLSLTGLAFGAIGNEHGIVEGLEVALINHARGAQGIQLGGVNVVNDIEGVQLGVVNVADNVKGIQVGLVNYTERLQGVQIGAGNISGKGGLPFMLGLNAGW